MAGEDDPPMAAANPLSASSRLDASVATAGAACNLGTEPAKFLEKFEDWYEHHSLLAETVGVQDEKN